MTIVTILGISGYIGTRLRSYRANGIVKGFTDIV